MVKNEKQHIEKTRAKQGFPADSPEPYKIAASTPFDFGAKNLTPYGGLFPVSTMLEKLGFKKLIEETLTCRSPKLRKALNLGRVTMLQSTLHAIHFKHVLNFGERQGSIPIVRSITS